MVGEYGLALELLERGRSASWSQLLGLRVSLDGVRAVDVALADKMCDIAKILQFTGAQHDYASAPNESAYAREEMAGNRHRLLVNEWNNSVEEVRKLPGCERFLFPKTVDELMLAAEDGPVVVITPVGRRTNVLILLPGKDLGIRAKKSRLGSLDPWDETDDWVEKDRAEALFEDMLSELWYKVVRPIFDAIAIAVRSNPPDVVQDRIFWCPTGELSLLPLHAAGDYTRAERGHKIYDFVVSSYIPTISSLLNAQRTSNTAAAPRILAVAVAQPTGQVHIGGTKQEIQYLRSHFPDNEDKRFEEVLENNATRESVLHSMRDASWVHFACHGVQDVSQPTKSALLLTGTEEIMLENLIQIDLPQAEFAFLSACQTATGSDTLPEDSIHIAAGMLMAGYKGVIGTIWSVFDRDAPDVARDVYGYLLRKKEGAPDYKDAAMALHLAVEGLRERVGTKAYLSWVPFIHIGS
ncbi:hypothetical protein CYLTODRAFT_349646 [Cylindrobasidium torrendii FP15055 ss-10]|uniref:CHAT domain-containing protein n=1 Tax=Cylindrobasidium torrendii FP15055 ss-10 TaxID=1314674 RepID=A0A0D7BH10_9AGAR|nr:hypothetical protein CYLTODRAFT_349646 [Cylindrobasidium torrendii FP15055 ss-10]